MKHIVYLDTEYLNSYVSQILDGLPQGSTSESGDKEELIDRDEASNKLTAGLNAPFLKLDAALGSENAQEIKDTSYGKELIQKIFHDNLLDLFESYLKDKELIADNLTHAQIGDFVSLSCNFNALDFGYYSSIVSADNIEVTKNDLAFPEIDEANKRAIEKGQTFKGSGAITKKIYEETLKPFKTMIDSFSLLFPSEQIFFFDGFISPVKEQYLRESIALINYMYGGKINIIGKVTNTSEAKAKPNTIKKEFAELTNSLNSLSIGFMEIGAQYKIVAPIALFFE